MEVTEDGKLMEVRLLHPENDCIPMVVKAAGNAMEVRPLQPMNEFVSLEVTVEGMVKFPVLEVGHLINKVLVLLYNTPSRLE